MPSAYKKKRNTQRKYKKKTNRTKKQYAGEILDTGRGVFDNFKFIGVPLLAVAATVAVPFLGVAAANAAKNAVLNKISKFGYEQITSKMINNVLTEIKEIFEDGNYANNVKKIRQSQKSKDDLPEDIASNTHYQCLAKNQKKTIDRLNVGPLVTVLRQTYSAREFSYDKDPDSPYTLFDTRKKLIKYILKMIFGDLQEYDAHINRFAIKDNSVLGSVGNLATTPLSFIGKKSMQTANIRVNDKQVYGELIDQLYDLLGVDLVKDDKGNPIKLTPEPIEGESNACKINYFAKYDKKPINTENTENTEKKPQYMIYTKDPSKDLILYEILNATKEEIKYFQNSNTTKPIITFQDLWKRYETKMNGLDKKQRLSKDDYQQNYDKMFKYLVNNTNNKHKIDCNRIASNIFQIVYNNPIFEVLYGENIPKYLNRSEESSNEQAFLNIFNFFFYDPPPPPEKDLPVYKKDEKNPDKYIPATDKNNKPKTIKRSKENNYWTWSPDFGYQINNCFGQKDKYIFIDSHKVCIERIEDNDTDDNADTSETRENPQKDDNGNDNDEIRNTETVGENKEQSQVPFKHTRRETEYEAQTNYRRKKKIDFSNKVSNVIAALKKKIEKMKNTPLCNDCNQTFASIKKMTIADIRAYLKEKKPCLCKGHIKEFLDKIIQEKNKKGGTKKRRRTSKGGSPRLRLSLEQKTTNDLIEEIHTIDGSLPLMKPIVAITRLLNYMINNNIPLDMHYTGNNPDISHDDRPLRALLFSYFTVMQNVQEKDETKFKKLYIEFFTMFLIGFINNQEINTIGYDPVYDYEHSIHNMIDLLCNPKYRQLKESILENMQEMTNNPKLNPATKEIVQKILDGDIIK